MSSRSSCRRSSPGVRGSSRTRTRRRTERGLAALVVVAVASLALPPAASAAVGPGAELAHLSALQDTTADAAQDTARQDSASLVRRRAAVPDSLRDQGADSLGALGRGDQREGPPFPGVDSIMRALMDRAGYRPVVYQGDTLRFSTRDRTIHIRERARLEREGEQLLADSVVYEGQTRFMTAYGDSKLINAKGDEVTSDSGPLFYNTDTRVGTVMNARTRWEVWNVGGNFTLEASDTLWVDGGRFTSCDLPEPHYAFRADRIKLVLGHIVVAWPVRLYFGDVPVFWLPFFAQDIRKGRHSGILTPRFGINDVVRNSRGHNRHLSNVGYYWAISDYMDAQLSLDWWSSRWTRIDAFFRYRWRQKFLDGRFGFSQFFLPEGGREMSLAWNHSQQFGERSDLRASIQFSSSQTFQRENEFDPERLVQQIRSDVGFTRRFDWGTLNLSGQRVQPLTEGGQTTLDAPQVSLTFSPLVLFPARSPLEASWYSDLTWTGNANFNRQELDAPGRPDRTTWNGRLTSGFSLGNFRFNSNGTFREQITDTTDVLLVPDTSVVDGDTAIVVDTTVIGENIRDGTIDWRTSFGYQQRLIGSTSLTPSVDLDGSFFRSNETGLDYVQGPTRFSTNATLNTDLYGFFPGVGPLQRIRHKFSPTFRWSYSPEVEPPPELAGLRGFNPRSVDERHELNFGLSQTFEAKLEPRRRSADDEGAEGDTTDVEEPREGRKISLLAIRTSALTYDFVEGELRSDRLSNNITSDLVRGLTVRTEHDLFDEKADGSRDFSPFLSALNLTFSLGGRAGGFAGGPSSGISRGRGIIPEAQQFEGAAPGQARGPDQRGRAGADGGEAARPWSLSVDYSLVRSRPREGEEGGSTTDRQSIRANLGFSPTPNWTISWRTQYDLEAGEFVDQILSLRRDLHRWSATFEFLRAANRNFLFEFRVNLNDLPDLKFDYRQESRRATTR